MEWLESIEARMKAATYIPSAPDYAALPDGSIWSLKSNWRGYGIREMKTQNDRYGYPKVRILIRGKRTKKAVHFLICEAFHGRKPSKLHEVCHINGIKNDNRAENLKWGTRKDNAQDRIKHGNCKAAENGRNSAWKLVKHGKYVGQRLAKRNRIQASS